MSINRRQLLKAFAVSSVVLTKPASAAVQIFSSTAGACNCVNILLHGFFFLEFQKNADGKDILVVATPKYGNHKFGCRAHGRWRVQEPAKCNYDFKNLAGSSKLDFPTKMLSFSRADLQASGNFINPASSYPILLTLPPPVDIVPLRLGKRSDLHLIDGNVKRSIDNYCDPDYMGLVIRLKYYLQKPDPLFPKALNYYAEHCMPVTDVKEMRMVLKAAKDYINSKFDLDMSDVPSATVLLDKQKDLPDEISPDDEISILEGDPCYTAQPERLKSLDELSVEPATCPIFGIRP